MTISRRDFLVAAGCAVCTAAAGCGTPVDGTVSPTGNTVTLTFAQFPKLGSATNGVVVDVTGHDPIAVIRTAPDTAVALDAICTHQGCTLTVDATQLSCGCHGSTFSFTGVVTGGPARTSLRHYTAAIMSDSIVVTLA